ncbi:MAG: hypothetical protein JWM75_227, partial [Sphingomonas bacterium]|nr:hypothetical protein [Sphingomonas bacterium]
MINKGAMRAALAATLLAGAAMVPASAQVGQPPVQSPVPAGLKEGTGAPFPKGQYAKLDSLPDWGGIWFRTFPPGARTPGQPKLKGKYKTDFEAWQQAMVKNDGQVKRTTSNCAPPGLPGIMQLPQYPYEFLFTPGRVTINQEAWMQTRHIWTDGRTHPEDPDPNYFGHSIGHWEGDTLVAESIGIKDSVPLGNGMAHSDKLRVTERIHLKPGDPNTLLNEITVIDPEALAEPFTTTITYMRDR